MKDTTADIQPVAGPQKVAPIAANYFAPLTGFRALAMFMVYICHYETFIPESWGWFPFSFIHEFHISLVMFFVLSGFLITYRYYDWFVGENFSLRSYAANRVIRIYPLWFILTTLTFIPLLLAGFRNGTLVNKLGLYFLNITLLKGFFHDLLFTGIGQGWSLTVEECFYFAAPVIVWMIFRKKNSIWAMPFVFLALGLGLVLLCRNIHYYGLMDGPFFVMAFTFFGRSTEFLVGVQIALWLRNRKEKLNGVPGMRNTSIGIFFMIVCLTMLALLRGNGSVYIKGAYHPAGMFVNTVLTPIAIAFFMIGLITENTMISRLLSNKFVQLMGKSSYAFYLIHVGFIHDFILTHITENYLVRLGLLVAIAIFIFQFVEHPLSKWLKKKFKVTSIRESV